MTSGVAQSLGTRSESVGIVLPSKETCAVAMLIVLAFVSGGSIKDSLPVPPKPGSIHYQDLFKAVVFAFAGAFGLSQFLDTIRFIPRWPAILGWMIAVQAIVTAPLAYSFRFALLGAGLLTLMMLFLPAALRLLGQLRTLKVLLYTLTAFLLATVLFFLLFPSHNLLHESESVRLAGLAHSNGVGQIAGMMVIAALCVHDRGGITNRQLARHLLLALVVFVWAQSRMPMLATLVVLLVYLWRKGTVSSKAVRRTLVIIGCCGLFLATALFVWECVPKRPGAKQATLLTRSGDESELRTLTGRDVIWAFALRHIGERPLIGHGYGCSLLVFRDGYEKKDLMLNFGSAHNMVLEAALNFGWLGSGCLVLSLLSLLGMALVRPVMFPDLTVIFLSLVGITEGVLLGPVPGPGTMFWLLALNWRLFYTPQATTGESGEAGPSQGELSPC